MAVENVYFIECYVTSEKLAREVCWAMCRAPSCHDVMVTKLDGYGYHLDCQADFEGAVNQVRSILGRKKSDRVDWLI